MTPPKGRGPATLECSWGEGAETGRSGSSWWCRWCWILQWSCWLRCTIWPGCFSSLYEPSGPWSRWLSPVSVVLSGWESLTPPGRDTSHRRLAPSRRWYSFTYPERMESWVGLGGKEGCTNIRISAKPGIELGTLCWEGRDLPTAQSTPAQIMILAYSIKGHTHTKLRPNKGLWKNTWLQIMDTADFQSHGESS